MKFSYFMILIASLYHSRIIVTFAGEDFWMDFNPMIGPGHQKMLDYCNLLI